MFIFEKSETCSFFLRNGTHILTRTHRKKCEDVFIFNIANQGTSLREILFHALSELTQTFKGVKKLLSIQFFCVDPDVVQVCFENSLPFVFDVYMNTFWVYSAVLDS